MEDNKKLAKSLVRSSVYDFLNITVNRVASLILVIILARMLLPEGFGIYSLAMSIAMIFVSIFDLGMTQSVSRYVAYEIGKKNKKGATAYFNYLLKRKIFLVLLTGLALAALSYPLAFLVFKQPALFGALLAASAYVIFYSINPFFSEMFYVFKNVKILAIKEFVLQSLKLIFVLIIFFVINSVNKTPLIFLFSASFSIE